MEADKDFIERILDGRARSAAAREGAESIIAAATAEMGAAVGSMLSFKAMDNPAFPVAAEMVRSLDDASEIPDFGAVVTAMVDGGSCSRLYAQARTLESDEFLTLTLHPARGGVCWTLEASSRGFDGSDRSGRKEYRSAEKALQAVKTRLLGTAIALLSGGELAGLPVLPEGDADAARTVADQIGMAAAAGTEMAARRKRHASEIARAAGAVMSIWSVAAARLGFLAEIGYPVGIVKAGRGGVATMTGSGASVMVTAGQTWSRITAEVLPEDPAVACIRVEDSSGRAETKGYVPIGEDAELAAELRRTVLVEIESAELGYLPKEALETAPLPSM